VSLIECNTAFDSDLRHGGLNHHIIQENIMARKAAETAENTEKATPAPKVPKVVEPREPGPTVTRSGAKGLVIETEGGTRTFTAGGDKGSRIAEYLLDDKTDLSRKQIAELVGCSQSRVAEVARVLGLTKARAPKETVDA